ncbi:MAG TPA: hypothetical protein VKU00_08680 [Chthonomonadaceae bacterium]|nr:hypothetical protein [Chthonomonadaceae bacterium]
MSKGLKIALAVLLPLLVILGGVYGLARIGLVPLDNITKSSPALARVFKAIGLKSAPPKTPANPIKTETAVAANAAPAPDPLAVQQAAFDKERTDLQTQIQNLKHPAPQANAPDPKNLARMADVYNQMPAEAVTKIFDKMPDEQVIALLRRMDERQVAQVLAAIPPDHAAQITQALARPAPLARTVVTP